MAAGTVYILKKHVPLIVRLATGGIFTGHFKIGKTRHTAETRLSDARTGSSYPVSIYAEYVVNDHHAMEAKLHRMFKHRKIQKRGRNEWYYLSGFDLWAIDRYIKGLPRAEMPTFKTERLFLAVGALVAVLAFMYAVWDGFIL